MSELLRLRAAPAPAAPALIDGISGGVLSWAQLEDSAMRLAARLAAQGVGPGDRVALAATPVTRFAAVLHACLAIGASLVPLPPRAPKAEHQRILDTTGAVVLLTGAGGRAQRLAANAGRAQQVRSSNPEVAVIHTSGSSGFEPKGVQLTVGNCVASAHGCAEALGGFDDSDRWLLTLGTHRIGGLAVLWRSAQSGAAVIHLPQFSEAALGDALDRRPTLVSMVPVMLHRVLDAGLGPRLRTLRAILVGGAPASRPEVIAWTELGLPVCPSYGMTETGSQVAVLPRERAHELAGAAGVVHSQAVVEVDDPEAVMGEILVGGPVLTPGYLDERLSARSFTGTGPARRLRTGDVGYLRDGVLTVTGRRDRLIITGGDKVQPQEVEAVLLEHPAVRDAAVWGSPDARYGSAVTAIVAGEIDELALQAWCRERLASHKVPRRFEVVETVPRTEDGKFLLQRARI